MNDTFLKNCPTGVLTSISSSNGLFYQARDGEVNPSTMEFTTANIEDIMDQVGGKLVVFYEGNTYLVYKVGTKYFLKTYAIPNDTNMYGAANGINDANGKIVFANGDPIPFDADGPYKTGAVGSLAIEDGVMVAKVTGTYSIIMSAVCQWEKAGTIPKKGVFLVQVNHNEDKLAWLDFTAPTFGKQIYTSADFAADNTMAVKVNLTKTRAIYMKAGDVISGKLINDGKNDGFRLGFLHVQGTLVAPDIEIQFL